MKRAVGDGRMSGRVPKKKCKDLHSTVTYDAATQKHPFVDRVHYRGVVQEDYCARTADGNLLFVFLKGVLPQPAVDAAAEVLKHAPKTADMRSLINGGIPPQSGIAGYYDYLGSPLALKCRKTAFTHDEAHSWPGVFPLVEHVNEVYRRTLPEKWGRQDAAIPDIVRVRGSVFSTLTVNSRFRTAVHTDAGDFDFGFGALTVLEAHGYKGLMLGMPEAQLCVDVRPGDLLLFDTHCNHGNTELEGDPDEDWERLTCVLYYRFSLGDAECMATYADRKRRADGNPMALVRPTNNLVNSNRRKTYTPQKLGPLEFFLFGAGVGAERVLALSLGSVSAAAFEWIAGYVDYDEAGVGYFSHPVVDYGIERERIKHSETVGSRQRRPHGKKYSGSWSEGDIRNLEKSIEAVAEDALMREGCLERLAGTTLAAEWHDSVQRWFEEAEKQREAGVKEVVLRHPQPATAFFDMAEVGAALFEAKNGLQEEEMESLPVGDRAAWWLGLAAHVCRRAVHEQGMPLSFHSLRRVNEKFSRFLTGVASQYRCPERRAALRAMVAAHTRTAPRTYTPPRMFPWVSNDRFDYQTEDAVPDYTSLGLQSPAELHAHLCAVPEVPPKIPAGRPVDAVVCRGGALGQEAPVQEELLRVFRQQQQLRNEELAEGTAPAGVLSVPQLRGVHARVAQGASIVSAGHLTGITESNMQAEVDAAARLLAPGGVLVVRDMAPRPVDHARLHPFTLAARMRDIHTLRDRPFWHCPETIAAAATASGLIPAAGQYQVKGSLFNEYLMAFWKPQNEQDGSGRS